MGQKKIIEILADGVREVVFQELDSTNLNIDPILAGEIAAECEKITKKKLEEKYLTDRD